MNRFASTFVSALLSLLLVAREASGLREIPERARGGKAYQQSVALQRGQVGISKEYTWETLLDHNNPDKNTTFTQRYFVDDQYYQPGGPVFFEIGGEGTMNSAPSGYLAVLAKNYTALIVSLEHRYYGQSIPKTIDSPMSTENLKRYLKVDQALADLASFTTYYQTSVNTATKTVPWFIFGGSYPGALASWYRSAYPEMSAGSLSSSGVVNCIVDYTGFDKHVSAAIGNQCADQIKRIESAFESMTESEDGWQQALGMFQCEKDMWKEDFYYMIADSWSMADQYSAKSQLCDAILAVGGDATDEQLTKAFAEFSNSFWGSDFCSMGFYNSESLADPNRWDINSRSWRWQTCYEVSYFNTAPSSGSLRNTIVDLDYHLRQCAHIFGEKMTPSSPDMNKKFGGETPNAHKVFYSDFSDDPWLRASVDYIVSSDQPYFLTQCDNCGHCKDLHQPVDDDPEELKESRKEFEKYLYQWLKEAKTDSVKSN